MYIKDVARRDPQIPIRESLLKPIGIITKLLLKDFPKQPNVIKKSSQSIELHFPVGPSKCLVLIR